MTDLTFTVLRLAFLALLWVFVVAAIQVLRRDLAEAPPATAQARNVSAQPAPAAVTAPTPGGKPPVIPAHSVAPPPASTPAGQPIPQAIPAGPTRLIVTEGPLKGTALPLTSSSILIGRAPSCTLVLDDGYSSSRHARIFPHNGTWYVEDLGSTNGSFLGSQRIEGVVALDVNVPVRIGQSVVELQR